MKQKSIKRLFSQGLLFVTTMLILSSCGVYKKYSSKTTIPTDVYGKIDMDSTDNIAQYRWQEIFVDPCLQKLIETALVNNIDVQTSLLNIEQAELNWKTSRLAYLPTMAFAPTINVGKTQGKEMDWGYNLGMQASWQLDIFGAGITNNKRKAKAAKECAEEYEKAVRCRLISSVAQLYYELMSIRRQYEIQTNIVSLYEKTYESVNTLYEVGQYYSPAVHQTKAQLESLRAGLYDLELSIYATEHSLCQLMNESFHSIEHSTLEEFTLPIQIQTGIPADLLKYRPDVRAAERQIEMAYYDVNLSKGNLYPNIALSANGGWEQLTRFATDPQQWFIQGIGSLVQPIFQGGKIRTDIKIKKIDQQIAVLNFRKTVIDAGHEVGDAIQKCNACANKAPHLTTQVQSLREAVLATQELMNNGTATYLEVLTSIQELLQAEMAETRNKSDEAKATIKLYSALGGY